MKRTFEETLEKIENPSQDTVVVSLPLSQSYLDEEDMERMTTAINESKKIKHLRLSTVGFSVRSGYDLVDAFMDHSSVTELTMPIWGCVHSSGQRNLMLMEEKLPLRAEQYKNSREKMTATFQWLFKINEAGIKYKVSSSSGEVIKNFQFPPGVMEQHIKPYIVGCAKKLIL